MVTTDDSSSAARPRKTRWYVVLLVAAAPSLLLLLGLEVAGRFSGFRPETWSALDERLGYRMREPSQRFPVAEARAVFVGDSLIYPAEPDRRGRFAISPDFFTEMLKSRGLPVVNLSGIGYGTDQQVLLLERHLDDLPPTGLVVLNVCLANDFIDNGNRVNPHDGYRLKPYFELEQGRLVLRDEHLDFNGWDRLTLWVRQRSGATFLVGRWLRGRDGSPPRGARALRIRSMTERPDAAEYDELMRQSAAALPVTRALLERMQRTVEQRLGAELLVLLHPSGYVPQDQDPLVLAPELAGFFRALDMNVFDLGCHYRQLGLDYDTVAWDRVGHLTHEGHRRIADLMEAHLSGRPLPAACLVARAGDGAGES